MLEYVGNKEGNVMLFSRVFKTIFDMLLLKFLIVSVKTNFSLK